MLNNSNILQKKIRVQRQKLCDDEEFVSDQGSIDKDEEPGGGHRQGSVDLQCVDICFVVIDM